MTDQNLIDQIATAVAAKVQPRVPLDLELWTITEIAEYLKMSVSQTRDRILPLPSFPARISMPLYGKPGGRSHPRWLASEVINWTLAQKEKRAA